MKKYLPILLFLSSILLYGCQTSMYTLTNEEKALPETDISKIKITTHDKIEGNYKEVGYVFAWGSSVEESIDNLKKQASEFGGDAVIKLQTNVLRSYIIIIFIPIPIDHYYCQGIVVKS